MTIVTIYQRQGYELVSHGNGWAYELIDLKDGRNCWFQDDDALQFRAEFKSAYEHGDKQVKDMFEQYLGLIEGGNL